MIGFSKQDQLKHAPGGNRKSKDSKKGSTFAKEVAGTLEAETGTKATRNYQGGEGGGLSRADLTVKGLPGWFFEVKNCERLEIPKWWTKVNQEAPLAHREAIIYNLFDEAMITFRLSDLKDIAVKFLGVKR